MNHPGAWVPLPVTPADLEQAQRLRAARDRRHPLTLYRPPRDDCRWIGELGELLLYRWLRTQTDEGRWLRRDLAGRPDFLVLDQPVDLKVQRRGGPLTAAHYVWIHQRHSAHPERWLAFAAYIVPDERLYFLGATTTRAFLARATRLEPGAELYPGATVLPGAPAYRAPIWTLMPPLPWLRELTDLFCLDLEQAPPAHP